MSPISSKANWPSHPRIIASPRWQSRIVNRTLAMLRKRATTSFGSMRARAPGDQAALHQAETVARETRRQHEPYIKRATSSFMSSGKFSRVDVEQTYKILAGTSVVGDVLVYR